VRPRPCKDHDLEARVFASEVQWGAAGILVVSSTLISSLVAPRQPRPGNIYSWPRQLASRWVPRASSRTGKSTPCWR
jgi:hypothetical protein